MRGFTLLELLVVISIMAILTIIAVPSFNEYSRNQKLNDAASQLQSILRQTQNNAQTGTVCKIGSNIYTASSWKITFNANNYSVSPVCVEAPASPTPIPQQYSLPSGIIISNVLQTDIPVPCGSIPSSIEYKNLSSEVSFNLGAGCTPGINALVEITLCLTDSATCPAGAPTKIVRVEKGGGIYINSTTPTPSP